MLYHIFVREFECILLKYRRCFKTSCAEIEIFQKHPVNATTIDALAPCVAKPSVAMVFNVRVN